MTDSIQLDILKRLTTHLQGITPANGYEFDMADAVFRGRLLYGDDAPVPMISIVEHLQGDVTTATAGENGIAHIETWILLVQGWTKNDPENPTDETYQLKAAVEERLSHIILQDNRGNPVYPDEYFLGLYGQGVITDLTIGPGIVSPPRQGISEKAFFYLPLGIGLALNISQPFAS